MAGAIGLLLLSGCGSLPRWFASTSQAEQQQELRRMDEQHLMLIQRLEQRVQRLDERQRRLNQQTRRLSGWRRAREEEQRLLQEELGKLELKREREQQQ
jgi:TolA-binding protein